MPCREAVTSLVQQEGQGALSATGCGLTLYLTSSPLLPLASKAQEAVSLLLPQDDGAQHPGVRAVRRDQGAAHVLHRGQLRGEAERAAPTVRSGSKRVRDEAQELDALGKCRLRTVKVSCSRSSTCQ